MARSSLLTLAWIVCLIIFLHLPCLHAPFYNIDEGIFATMGQGIIQGKVIYRDLVDMCAPSIPFVYAGIFKLFGSYNMLAVRISLMALVCALAWVVYHCALISGNKRFAYVGGVFLVIFSYAYRATDMLAFEAEWLVALCLSFGVYFLIKNIKQGRLTAMFASGIFFGCAVFSKGFALIVYPGMVLFYFFFYLRDGVPLKKLIVSTLVNISGSMLVASVWLGYFFYKGALTDMFFWAFEYPAHYYVPALGLLQRTKMTWQQLWTPYTYLRSNNVLMVFFLLFTGWLLYSTFKGLASREKKEQLFTDWLWIVWSLLSYAAISSSGRFFGHYFIIIIPPLCLICGRLMQVLFQQPKEALSNKQTVRYAKEVLKIAVIIAVIVGIYMPLSRYKNRWEGWKNVVSPLKENQVFGISQEVLEAAEYIRQFSRKDDTFFVWGFYPELYILTQRRPASKFINCNFLTGLLPWTNRDPKIDTSDRIVPGSWNQLMEELKERMPLYIIDTSVSNHRAYKKYPLGKYPLLHDFVVQHYQAEKDFSLENGQPSLRLYRKKQ